MSLRDNVIENIEFVETNTDTAISALSLNFFVKNGLDYWQKCPKPDFLHQISDIWEFQFKGVRNPDKSGFWTSTVMVKSQILLISYNYRVKYVQPNSVWSLI